MFTKTQLNGWAFKRDSYVPEEVADGYADKDTSSSLRTSSGTIMGRSRNFSVCTHFTFSVHTITC